MSSAPGNRDGPLQLGNELPTLTTKAITPMKGLLLLPSLVLLVAGALGKQQSNEIDYLGQDPPGSEATVFAPGVVSSDLREHGVPVFTTNGNEVFFTRQIDGVNTILWARRERGVWSVPEPAPFNSGALDDGSALFPGEDRIFFGSRRPHSPGEESLEQTDIWQVERDGDGWGEARLLEGPVNSAQSDGYPSFTSDGTMYFHSQRGGDETLADIYRARWLGESFGEPERLPAPVNSGLYEAGSFVAPDESYLIYLQIDPALPEPPLLKLTFRTQGDSWTEPIELAEVLGLPRTDLLLGRVSPDGRFLFVLAGGDVYWVDTSVIEGLRY